MKLSAGPGADRAVRVLDPPGRSRDSQEMECLTGYRFGAALTAAVIAEPDWASLSSTSPDKMSRSGRAMTASVKLG